MKKSVFGVGVNDANYAVNPREKIAGKWEHNKELSCPYYRCWVEMLRRCYSQRVQKLRPTYNGVTVCTEWLTFSAFKCWMEKQDWEGKVLDKDLLTENNSVYGPEGCCFITGHLNSFLTIRERSRGDLPLGVGLHNNGVNKYRSLGQTDEGKRLYLGLFSDPMAAHLTYLNNKKHLLENVHLVHNSNRASVGIRRIISKIEHHINNRLELVDL